MVTSDTLESIVDRVNDRLGCDNLKPIDTEEGGRVVIGRGPDRGWIKCPIPNDMWENPTLSAIEQLIIQHLNPQPSVAAA
jgi:hypothetical protein